MATNNVNNKVTFWNNVSFTPENVKNNFILNDIAGLDNKGIYFNSNKNYPHIIYNGYIYTTGSYISNYTYNNNVDPKGQVNVITNITADPFSKSISYQYTTIDIAYILKKIDELEKQASIKDISDTITLTPDNNNISLVVGESSQAISYSTTSTRLSKVESDKPNIASVSKNDADHTITITAANGLNKDNDGTQTAYIILTSYSGIIGDKRYTSTEKKIKVDVNKKTQTISYTAFNTNLTVNESTQLTIIGAHTDISYTTAASNIELTKSENTINITPNSVGTGGAHILVYAKSSTTYTKSNTLDIQVTVSEQPVENIYYWYAGQTEPTSMTSNPTPSSAYTCNNWFEIGTTLPTSIVQRVTGGTMGNPWYAAMPTDAGLVAGTSADPDTSITKQKTITINGVKYDVWYASGVIASRFNLNFNK